MTRISLTFCIIAVLVASTSAFTSNSFNSQRSGSTKLMVFGPKQALAIEKRKNPQAFESTIQGLMKTKRLTREQAEKVCVWEIFV